MTDDVRWTIHGLTIISMLLRKPQGLAGADMIKAGDMKSGTVYPLLRRLERAGWIFNLLENGDPSDLGRPLRRVYKLTISGKKQVRAVLAPFQYP